MVVVVAPGLGNQVETLARKGSAEFNVSVSYLRGYVCGFRVYLQNLHVRFAMKIHPCVISSFHEKIYLLHLQGVINMILCCCLSFGS